MEYFKIENSFKYKNAKLVDAVAYTNNLGSWYMRLKYTYEDEEGGVHERYYPKVEFPFFLGKLPTEEFSADRFGRGEMTLNLFSNEVAAFRTKFWNPVSEQMMSDVCVVDNLIKPAIHVHEMTVEEIEKKLGYKVKIVNKGEK